MVAFGKLTRQKETVGHAANSCFYNPEITFVTIGSAGLPSLKDGGMGKKAVRISAQFSDKVLEMLTNDFNEIFKV